jgi:hypothetical protein
MCPEIHDDPDHLPVFGVLEANHAHIGIIVADIPVSAVHDNMVADHRPRPRDPRGFEMFEHLADHLDDLPRHPDEHPIISTHAKYDAPDRVADIPWPIILACQVETGMRVDWMDQDRSGCYLVCIEDFLLDVIRENQWKLHSIYRNEKNPLLDVAKDGVLDQDAASIQGVEHALHLVLPIVSRQRQPRQVIGSNANPAKCNTHVIRLLLMSAMVKWRY